MRPPFVWKTVRGGGVREHAAQLRTRRLRTREDLVPRGGNIRGLPGLPSLILRDPRVRILAIVAGDLALLHRDGLAGPKAVYLVIVAASVGAAVPAIRPRRSDSGRAERRILIAAAMFGSMIICSLPVARGHGTGLVAWMRDASVYGLLAAAPLLALDLRRVAGPRWVRWVLVAAGLTCAVSFVVHWLTLRQYVDLPIDTILLPSLYLPAGLFAFASACGIRRVGLERLVWCALAGTLAAGIAATGSRTFLILLAAPLVQLALPARRRLLTIAVTAIVLATAITFAASNLLGLRAGNPAYRLSSVTTFLAHPGRDPSWRQRTEEGANAVHAWQGSPVLGVGPGHAFSWHNFYGQTETSFLIDSPAGYLAKFGVVGVMLLLVFAATVGTFLLGRLREGGDTALGAEALLGFGAIVVCGLALGNPIEDKGFPLALLLLFALALPGNADPRTSVRRLRREALAVACLVALACSMAAILGRQLASASSASVPSVSRTHLSGRGSRPSILNANSAPLRVVSRFEDALWAGNGQAACELLAPSGLARYTTLNRCIRVLSIAARGDLAFNGSTATPVGDIHGRVRTFLVRRRTGAKALYVMREDADGRWHIASFLTLRPASTG